MGVLGQLDNSAYLKRCQSGHDAATLLNYQEKKLSIPDFIKLDLKKKQLYFPIILQ